jgi:23S rRNA 5-hydroxycytidine C2501 synthase
MDALRCLKSRPMAPGECCGITNPVVSPIELLAPAKDLETGIAAINCGADALYIGTPRFGAREAAANSLGDIERLAAYAHRYWGKVYAAVNTILRDDEIETAVGLCHDLHRAGVDGLIVQDVGLLECELPHLPLIASTQMHNHTPKRVAFLEKVGFVRAILARELDLDQIRTIRAATAVELEVFIHGALCVCMSGQCTLSYAMGGRSGNRGQCAQPCWRGYSLEDAQGKTVVADRHLLSLRDLNLTPHLGDLLAAGVSSFKIEGRLKNKAYVMNVVGHYRQVLDQVLAAQGGRKASSGSVTLGFTPNPDKTFNRGYTRYFITGRGAEVASPDSPKHVGEPLGRVTALGRDSFTLDAPAPLSSGDGITFYDRDHQLEGSTVNRVQGKTVFPQKIDGLAAGARVFRNHDHAFAKQIAQSRPVRKIAVALKLRETRDGLALEATDEDGVRAEAALACAKVTADKPEKAQANIEHQLSKLGDTEFAASTIEVEWETPLHLSAAQVNSLRRNLAESLSATRAQARPTREVPLVPNNTPFPAAKLSYLANVLNQKAAAFYRRHGVSDIEPAAESGLDLAGRTVMTTRYCLKYELGLCPREGTEEEESTETDSIRTSPFKVFEESVPESGDCISRGRAAAILPLPASARGEADAQRAAGEGQKQTSLREQRKWPSPANADVGGLSPMGRGADLGSRHTLKGLMLRTSHPASALSSSSVPSTPPPEPWFLVDDEGRRLRLRFRCEERHCVMEVVYKG